MQALKIDPENNAARQNRLLLSSSLYTDKRNRRDSLLVIHGDDIRLPHIHKEIYYKILTAVLQNDIENATDMIKNLEQYTLTPELSASFALARILLRNQSLVDSAAKRNFLSAAKRHKRTLDGDRALAFTRSPSSNPFNQYLAEKKKARIDKWNYALLNRPLPPSNTAIQRPRKTGWWKRLSNSLSPLPFPATIQRWVFTAFSASHTHNKTIDSLIEMTRHDEFSSHSDTIHKRIADHFAKKHQIEKALHHYNKAGLDSEIRRKHLNESEARRLLTMIKKETNLHVKSHYLELLIEEYPITSARCRYWHSTSSVRCRYWHSTSPLRCRYWHSTSPLRCRYWHSTSPLRCRYWHCKSS